MSDSYEIFYLCIAMLGLVIRCFTIGYAGARTSGRNTKEQIADSLNQFDIYSATRNPLYLGNFFMWLGCVLMFGNIYLTIAFVFLFYVFYERIIFAEEQFLLDKFGKDYEQWANKTPIFFPKFTNYKASGKKFDLKRVCIQEKNGLLAIFSVFLLLEVWEKISIYINSASIKIGADDYFLLLGLIFSILFYAFFKSLKKKKKRQQA